MTVSQVTEGGDALSRVRRENETLYAVIKTVSSSLALERVLGGIVEIATDATGCNACVHLLRGGRPSRAARRVSALRPPRGHAVAGAATRA